MGKWLFRTFFVACGVIAIRLVVGYFYPEMGGKKVKEAVAVAIPIHRFVPLRDQVPLTWTHYRNLGFPDARPAGSWVRQDLTDFHMALDALTHDFRESFPGADGDYGKSVFSKITKLEKQYSSLPVQEQAEVVELIAKIHDSYIYAHNFERIQYDREICLLRGVIIAMTDKFLGKIEKEIEHVKSDIASATGVLGYGGDKLKLERRILSDAIFEHTSESMRPGLFEMRKGIEELVEETSMTSSIRPQAQKLALRYYEQHLASVSSRIGGDHKKWIEKGYRRASDAEVKELYRRVLVSFDEVSVAP